MCEQCANLEGKLEQLRRDFERMAEAADESIDFRTEFMANSFGQANTNAARASNAGHAAFILATAIIWIEYGWQWAIGAYLAFNFLWFVESMFFGGKMAKAVDADKAHLGRSNLAHPRQR